MGDERPVCSSISLATDEPLIGTASRFRSWLLIEQPGRWGHDALIDSGLPSEVGAVLRERGHRLGVRVLLIKRRGSPAGTGRRCFVAFTGRQERRLARFEVDDPAALLDLDLEAMVASKFEGFGEPVSAPLFLVCTHGKHDPCCARLGGPLYRALADFADGAVWEATHVGGDRFAGNLVCLPHGFYYGRIGPEDGVRVAAAYGRGEVVLHHFRGRSAYPPAIQAAEHFLRVTLDLRGVDDLTLRGHHRAGSGGHVVEFEGADGRVHAVRIEVGRRDPRLLTCKATEPGRPRDFVLRGVESSG